MIKENIEIWKTSNALHAMKGTNRAWLRQKWEEGKLRRREIEGYSPDGIPRIKYLYCVQDVERELALSETKGGINEY